MPGSLFERPELLTGNTAKIRVIVELADRLASAQRPLEILDVGCAGPTPFNQWRYLLAEFPERIRLTGVDVRGLERARQAAAGLPVPVEILEVDAYRMAGELGRTFDAVVSTQVLEHVRRPAAFLEQVREVLRPGAPAYLTLDSGHLGSHGGWLERLADVVRPVLPERYHDRGLTAETLRELARGAGLEIEALRYYNLPQLKRIQNHEVAAALHGPVLRSWFELEEQLNEDAEFLARHRSYFAGIYLRLRRP